MAQTYNLLKIQKKVRKELDDERYRHTLGVMYMSAALAMRYREDIVTAQVAGLLHDCAKCIPNDKKLKMCARYGIEISEVEKKAPSLVHSKLGAWIAEHEYGIEDEDILQAIRWHTTGRPGMSMLEKIVFIADYIEPMRYKAANLDNIRTLAFININSAIQTTLEDTLTYLKNCGGSIDEMTARACAYYTKLAESEDDDDEDEVEWALVMERLLKEQSADEKPVEEKSEGDGISEEGESDRNGKSEGEAGAGDEGPVGKDPTGVEEA